jgi:hypothetical protein
VRQGARDVRFDESVPRGWSRFAQDSGASWAAVRARRRRPVRGTAGGHSNIRVGSVVGDDRGAPASPRRRAIPAPSPPAAPVTSARRDSGAPQLAAPDPVTAGAGSGRWR